MENHSNTPLTKLTVHKLMPENIYVTILYSIQSNCYVSLQFMFPRLLQNIRQVVRQLCWPKRGQVTGSLTCAFQNLYVGKTRR